METTAKKNITVEAVINAPIEKVWKFWNDPKHITQWNTATEEWHTPKAENNLEVGGKFLSRMEAKDGSNGFDFEGVYEEVKPHQLIIYSLLDGRKVKISFDAKERETTITETFEAEDTYSLEMQQGGWQAILNNFKKHVESTSEPEKLHFEILINAPVEKVYNTMLDEKHYKEWTAVFNPTSHYVGSWEKDSKILFIGCDANGETGGMVSRIKENIPQKFVSIEHLGMYQNGNEITTGKEVEGWAGALENYTFEKVDDNTRLSIDMDTNEEFKAMFSELWPKGLNKLKSICEA